MIGQRDSALSAYTRYVETPYFGRTGEDMYSLPFVLSRLGELHEARGEHERALAYYARLLDLWKNAAVELQPRVRAVEARVQALSGRG